MTRLTHANHHGLRVFLRPDKTRNKCIHDIYNMALTLLCDTQYYEINNSVYP